MASTRRFGLDVGIYGKVATPEAVLDMARRAEALEFDSLWLADHVAFPTAVASRYPYSATGDFPTDLSDPLLEPIATLGVLAGATKRLRLGTAVLVMPYRNPVLLGRMLATLDQFSGGRIVLGAGVGWLEEEFVALDGPPFAKRGKATDEYIEIVKKMCAGGVVSYSGEIYRFEPLHSSPGSVQRPHPPIIIGGVTDVALRRVARLGDGWLALAANPAQLGAQVATVRRLWVEHGRAGAPTLVCKLFLSIGTAKPSAFDARMPGTGSVEQIIDDLKALLDLGFETIAVRHHADSPAEQIAQITRFATDIIPKV
jgi:probable F420-dependent oxidoreductase